MSKISLQTPPNAVAFQHNHLIRTPLKMGVVEARIFVHALGQIHQNDKAFKPIQIPLAAIVGDNPNGGDYERVKAACDALLGQILNILPANARRGNLDKVTLMARIKLDIGTGFITGQFNELAKPYLLDLTATKNFTSANIQNLLTFTNPNSARLYWILLSYRNMDSPTHTVKKQIELDELKLWLLKDSEKYPVWAEFKRWVLDPIEEDFKRIGFGATWEPHRTGKKITALLFTVPKDKKPRKLLASAPSTDTGTDNASFSAFLSGTKDRKLQAAYRGLRDVNQLTDSTAQEVIRYIAQHPEKAPEFYATRHRIRTHKEPVAHMSSFSLKAINAALGTAFK